MRLEKWPVALRAFSQVVQLEPTDGEAWGNLGAINCHMNRHEEAFQAFSQGTRQMHNNWRMWGKHAFPSVRTRRYGPAMYAQTRLIQLHHLRKDDSSPIDFTAVNALVRAVSLSLQQDNATEEDRRWMHDRNGWPASKYASRLQALLEMATQTVKGSPELWNLYSRLFLAMGKPDDFLKCREKELRALQSEGWEEHSDASAAVVRVGLEVAKKWRSAATGRPMRNFFCEALRRSCADSLPAAWVQGWPRGAGKGQRGRNLLSSML